MDATEGTVQLQLQQLHTNNEDRSIVDALGLAVNLDITNVVKSPLLNCEHAAENSTRSSPELRIDSPIYQQDMLTTIPSSESAAPLHVTSSTDALGETINNALDLAVNLDITTAVRSTLLHSEHAAEKSTRLSPELRIDSPVDMQDVLMTEPSSEPAEPFRLTSNTDVLKETSLIDALDLVIDRRITAAAVQQLPILQREHFRSSPELRIQSPIYGSVKSVLPVPVEFSEYSATRSVGRRRSAWKRAKRFVWKSLVNVGRKVLTHNHESEDDGTFVRQQLTNSLKRKCDELITEQPSKIIRKEIASNSHSESLLQNDINRVRKNLNAAKLRTIPKLPSNLEELHISVSEYSLITNLGEKSIYDNDSVNNIIINYIYMHAELGTT
ncbi:hypothetical protein QTP88_026588 [Uroleucon formosanum]